jgi:hypothetical protein
VLTGLGIAAFVLSFIHLIRTEDRNLKHAASRLAARDTSMGGE